jgi:serine O-acetyltransferase
MQQPGTNPISLSALLKEDLAAYAAIEGGKFAAFRDRNFWACVSYRLAHWAPSIKFAPLRRTMCLCCGFLWLVASTIAGTEIKAGAIIGRRFVIHTSQAILIADGVIIGDDCIINTGVCIVHRANSRGEGVPVIGNHVYFGVGCKVIGNITVGDYAVLGANAVVLKDVPAGHAAVGIPAVAKPLRVSGRPEG